MADILPVDAYDLAGQGATGPEKLRMGHVGVVVHGAQPIEFDAQVSLDLLHPTLGQFLHRELIADVRGRAQNHFETPGRFPQTRQNRPNESEAVTGGKAVL